MRWICNHQLYRHYMLSQDILLLLHISFPLNKESIHQGYPFLKELKIIYPTLPVNFQFAPPSNNNNNNNNVLQLPLPLLQSQLFNNTQQSSKSVFPFPIPYINYTNMNMHRPVAQLPNRTPNNNMNLNGNANISRPAPLPLARQNISAYGVTPLPPTRRGLGPPLPPHRNNNN